MNGSGRAPPYEEDYELPMYDEEVLFNELAVRIRTQDIEKIRSHIILTDDLENMETLTMFLTIKYCIVVAAMLIVQDSEYAQRVLCTAEKYWRVLFEAACDQGDVEAYVPLHALRGYLNRLDIMRIKAGAPFFMVRGSGDNVDEGDMPPAYSKQDPYALPPYDVLGEMMRMEIRRKALAAGSKPEKVRRKSMTKAHVPKTPMPKGATPGIPTTKGSESRSLVVVLKNSMPENRVPSQSMSAISPSECSDSQCSESQSLVVVLRTIKRKRSCSSALAMPLATRLRSSYA